MKTFHVIAIMPAKLGAWDENLKNFHVTAILLED